MEFNDLKNNHVLDLVTLPNGKKTIKSTWVYKTKKNENGKVTNFKARLVAKGCSQSLGVDFIETFPPVSRYSTIRTLISLAVLLDMTIDHWYVSTAFLNGDLKEIGRAHV